MKSLKQIPVSNILIKTLEGSDQTTDKIWLANFTFIPIGALNTEAFFNSWGMFRLVLVKYVHHLI